MIVSLLTFCHVINNVLPTPYMTFGGTSKVMTMSMTTMQLLVFTEIRAL